MEGVANVRARLCRAAAALNAHNVPYAVIGGNAIAEWVGRVDTAAVRNTQDVDILLNRTDLVAAKWALESAGFVYRHAAGIDMFLDGPNAKARDAVHIVFAGEKVRADQLLPTPLITESEPTAAFQVLSLAPLVMMKLTAYRDKDRTHLRDLIDVGLVDATWPARFPEELAVRLQQLLDTPDG